MPSSRQLATDQSGSSNYLVSRKAFGWSSFWWPSAVGLIAVVLCPPLIRYVSWLGDEGVPLHGAERMLHGDRVYLDFLNFYRRAVSLSPRHVRHGRDIDVCRAYSRDPDYRRDCLPARRRNTYRSRPLSPSGGWSSHRDSGRKSVITGLPRCFQ